jgi:hypothetical protein
MMILAMPPWWFSGVSVKLQCSVFSSSMHTVHSVTGQSTQVLLQGCQSCAINNHCTLMLPNGAVLPVVTATVGRGADGLDAMA